MNFGEGSIGYIIQNYMYATIGSNAVHTSSME